jgi:hypothetical protein
VGAACGLALLAQAGARQPAAGQGVTLVSREGLWGLSDAQGRVVAEAMWDSVQPLTLWPDEPARTRHFFTVRKGARHGVMDTQGRMVLPVAHTHVAALNDHSPLVVVSAGQQQGLCDLVTARCPMPLGDGQYERLEDVDRDGDLLRVTRDGRQGLIDGSGREVLAARHDEVRWLSGGGPTWLLLTRTGLHREVLALSRDPAGAWRWQAPERPVPLPASRDDHPQAVAAGAVIDARYLPEGLTTDTAIEQAARTGVLRQARYPSIQLAGPQAFVGFDVFALASPSGTPPQVLQPDTVWAHCPGDGGWQLKAWPGPATEAHRACARQDLPTLRFTRAAGADALACADCAPLGLPTRWVRQDEARLAGGCPAPAPWDQASARRDYERWVQAWLAIWRHTLRDEALPKAASEHWRDHQASPSRALSTLSALKQRPERLLEDIGLQPAAAPKRPMHEALLHWVGRAQPAGWGGVYPEPEARFAALCAETWYLRWPELDALARSPRSAAVASLFTAGYGLPAAGSFQRQAYPFLTFERRPDGGLRLTGISREFLLALWLLEGGR